MILKVEEIKPRCKFISRKLKVQDAGDITVSVETTTEDLVFRGRMFV